MLLPKDFLHAGHRGRLGGGLLYLCLQERKLRHREVR